MSLISALTAGTAGMQSSSLELTVVGDNIANANTVGFKSGRAAFQDVLLQGVIGASGGGQMGLGSRVLSIQRIITQGALTNTGLATDLAIEGNGYFVLKGNHNGLGGQFYSRAGQMTVDNDGYLVSLEGLRVQGYAADPAGRLQGGLNDLLVGTANAQARPTDAVTIKANLASTSISPPPFDPLNPTTTSNFQTSVTMYDSIGKSHSVQVNWRKETDGEWQWFATTDGANLTAGTPGQQTVIANGTLSFDTSGRLTAETQVSDFNPIGAVNPQPLTFNFGDPIGTGGTGLQGVTQTASQSSTLFVSQTGTSAGALANIQINNNGEVVGAFTNGTQRVLGQVAIADFDAADRLTRIGGNLLLESMESGQPTIGGPSNGGRGSIASGSLEQSNVDMANEFVRMIAAQRAFQANSKTISTADQMLAELMTLRR